MTASPSPIRHRRSATPRLVAAVFSILAVGMLLVGCTGSATTHRAEPAPPPAAEATNHALASYYGSILEEPDADRLRTRLYALISQHRILAYDELWSAVAYTDEDLTKPGHVRLLYSGWVLPADDHGVGKDQWNREHVWAKSRGDFGTKKGAGTDLHHVRAEDVTVNSSRNNLGFDEGGTEDLDDGRPTGNRMDGDSWEPRDAVKGDVARMMLYMDLRYEPKDGLDLQLVEEVENGKEPLHGRRSTLLKWHRDDPVDDVERRRNDRIHERQGNRNPFIDKPELVKLLYPK